MLTAEEIKRNAARHAAGFVETGMTIGMGTGSTVYFLIETLADRVKSGLQLNIVPTSRQTAQLAQAAGITVCELNEIDELVLTIDGADEVDEQGQLIKGGGGALLQEKMVAAASEQLIIIADESKLVPQLGRFPLPVEVIPFGYRQVEKKIMQRGDCSRVVLREKDGTAFITDHGHYILDCHFERIQQAGSLNTALHNIPGVVETGLFIGMAAKAIIGRADGTIATFNYR